MSFFLRGCSSAGGPLLRHFRTGGFVTVGGGGKKNTVWLASVVAFYDLRIPLFIDTIPPSGDSLGGEQDESCLDCVCKPLTFHQSLFFSPHSHKKQLPKKKIRRKKEKKSGEKKASETPKVYRMRGQIYSQSGSRVMWLDAFLQCSFLPLPLSFFEVSPRLPPLPQHSSPFVYSI